MSSTMTRKTDLCAIPCGRGRFEKPALATPLYLAHVAARNLSSASSVPRMPWSAKNFSATARASRAVIREKLSLVSMRRSKSAISGNLGSNSLMYLSSSTLQSSPSKLMLSTLGSWSCTRNGTRPLKTKRYNMMPSIQTSCCMGNSSWPCSSKDVGGRGPSRICSGQRPPVRLQTPEWSHNAAEQRSGRLQSPSTKTLSINKCPCRTPASCISHTARSTWLKTTMRDMDGNSVSFPYWASARVLATGCTMTKKSSLSLKPEGGAAAYRVTKPRRPKKTLNGLIARRLSLMSSSTPATPLGEDGKSCHGLFLKRPLTSIPAVPWSTSAT
mmetsp:Transcript_113078/g.325035  ORF Transcript_113078/g.325035 Transcript_113078/m.325035 type:complete len:328 (+) Transcript_113078:146-1129(+)